jgi:hypothetical protein
MEEQEELEWVSLWMLTEMVRFHVFRAIRMFKGANNRKDEFLLLPGRAIDPCTSWIIAEWGEND